MTFSSITILKPHFADIQNILFPGDGAEHAAYVLFGRAEISPDPWIGERHTKYISHQVIAVPTSEVVSNGPQHITWKMDSFVRALKLASHKRMTLGVIHSHPGGYVGFSPQDDVNECGWIELARNRNGPEAEVVSMVATPDGSIVARTWFSQSQYADVSTVRVIGERITLHYRGRGVGLVPEALSRQALALGDVFNQDLSRLRVGIVGLGGTGSALNFILARMAPGYVALFDKDIVDETNRNRLHGATADDVKKGRYKVDVAERVIKQVGLGTCVAKFPFWIDDPRCFDGLKSCDVIFGGTDDNDGRVILNQIPFHYGIPVFDLGLALEASKTPPYRMLACDGRVTVVEPGSPCLICREVIDLILAREESLKRSSPEEYERLKEEAYVRGEGNPSPAVVFLTTETATMAIQEFVQRLQGFRGEDGSNSHLVRKFHLQTDRKPAGRSQPYCPVCGQTGSWGRGDETRFLGLIDTKVKDD